jgi:hypothetical protein
LGGDLFLEDAVVNIVSFRNRLQALAHSASWLKTAINLPEAG